MVDPICNMKLDDSDIANAPNVIHNERGFYFCSKECAGRFKENPERFSKEPLMKLVGAQKIFKMGQSETKALRGLDMCVWSGDFTVIIGSSGSGKSTALKMLGLLDRPTSGRVFLKGKDITLTKDEERAELRSKTFGFVFQQYNLIPWLTAYENVILPLIFADKKVDENKIHSMFEDIGLKDRMKHRPFELSGGEQQRTAFLRSLVNDPEIILGDEPTGNLDSETGNRLLEFLIDLNKKQNKTLIIVTHDMDISDKADQIITLKDGSAIKDHQGHKHIYAE
jgi:putative ABC transport system ATP-binding protein